MRPVVVVGAGCAGLSAAYILRKRGVEVTVLEANDTAGGRCRCVYEQGFTFSLGAVLTQPQWKTTFAYLDELGLRNRAVPLRSQRHGSGVSTEEFVLKHGGPDVLDYVAHPLLASFVISRPQEVSIIHPILLMSLMKGMYALDGGLGALTAGLYEKVRESVRLSTPVRQIVISDGRAIGVRIDGGFIRADAVICAVDAVIARQLMPDLPASMRGALETCKYSSTYYYQFAQRNADYAARTDLFGVQIPASEPTPLAYIGCAPRPGTKPVIVAGTRGWEDAKLTAMTDEDRLRLVIHEIKRYLPDFSQEAVVTKMFRWDRAVNLESPGQFTAIRNLLKYHMHDVQGLHLAGEYLFPLACTEGALLTGKAAAERVIAANLVPAAMPAA